MTSEPRLISPTLENLRRAVQAGDTAAVSAFWQTIGNQGTPLIEPIEGDDEHSLVTFIWRAADEDQSVELETNLSGRDATEAMSRLPDTDLWYKTFRAHNETRERYWFVLGGENFTDPLNTRQHVFPDDEEIGFTGRVSSVFALPDAPPQSWNTPRPNIREGKVSLHRIRSEILDDVHRVWIYTPPGYTPDGPPYGYLLFLDGWYYLRLHSTPTILDNLLDDGLVPPLVAIMVSSPLRKTRARDLGCYPPFADFLTRELLPWARQDYNLTDDPTKSAVAGGSRGGLMAAYMGLRHSDIFSNVICQSGAFGWRPQDEEDDRWLARQYAAVPKLPLQFYLEAGLLETEVGIVPLGKYNFLEDTRHMRDVLQARGYRVTYSEFHGGHNQMNWIGTLANAVLALLGNGASVR